MNQTKKKKKKNNIFKGVLRLLSKHNMDMPKEENIDIDELEIKDADAEKK
jgi:hypothetical protein